MTPAPISVERFTQGDGCIGGSEEMLVDVDGEWVRHSDYAALLHQLAELERELHDAEHEVTIMERNLIAAERAREEARKELDSAMHEIAGLSPNGYADSYVDRIAASGGKDNG